MTKTRMTALIATALLALGTLAVSGSASATTYSTHSSFTPQAIAAGLTPQQAAALQARANHYLATMGGKQIAPNKIDLNGEGIVSLGLPHETHSNNFHLNSKLAVDNCDYPSDIPVKYGHFCAYHRVDPYYRDDNIDMYHCRSYELPDGWNNTDGYWNKNQTNGTRARFYGQSGNLLYTTAPAPSSGTYNWVPVWTIRPC